MIRTLVVDDEMLAREGILVRLRGQSDFEVVGEAGDGPAAVDAIRRLRPELVFLDVELPEFDGFGVLERVGTEHLPLVVFVTAFGHYAVKAFDAHALDYLVKPVGEARFHDTLRRIRQLTLDEGGRERAYDRLVNSLTSVGTAEGHVPEAIPTRPEPLQRFVVKDKGRYRFIRADAVDWFASAANYVELHAEGRAHLIRVTMNELMAKLDQTRFARIHRSTIVNIDRVKEVVVPPQGEYQVVLCDGTTLRLARGYRDRLLGAGS